MPNNKSSLINVILIIMSMAFIVIGVVYYIFIIINIINTAKLSFFSVAMLGGYLVYIMLGAIPFIVAYALLKQRKSFQDTIKKTAITTPKPLSPLFALILSFLFGVLFCVGYSQYIVHLLYDTHIAETYPGIADIKRYFQLNSIPYIIFLFMSLFYLNIFIRNNRKTTNYYLATTLFGGLSIIGIDWSFLVSYLGYTLELGFTATFNGLAGFMVKWIPYGVSLMLGSYFLYLGITGNKKNLPTQTAPVADKIIGSGQLKNFLELIAVLTFSIYLLFTFGKLSIEDRDMVLLAFYQQDIYRIIGKLEYQIIPHGTFGQIIHSISVGLLINGIVTFCYVYFQRSIGYLFAIIAALSILMGVSMDKHTFIFNFMVCYIVIGYFMYIALLIIKLELKKKLTTFIKQKFDRFRDHKRYGKFIPLLEYLLIGFPYAALSSLFIAHYYAITQIQLIISIQASIVMVVIYVYFYKQYREGKDYFNYNIF